MVSDLQSGLSTLEYPLLTQFPSGGLGWGMWGSDRVSRVGSVWSYFLCVSPSGPPHAAGLAHVRSVYECVCNT